MTSIDKWTKVDELKDGDTVPIHSAQNADQRGISAANVKTYMQTGAVKTTGDETVQGLKSFEGGIRFPNATATDISSATSALNTEGKAAGKVVLDTTNSRLMVAIGADPTSNWTVVDGSVSVTPA